MRFALVAGPAAGHAFPTIALGCRLRDAGHAVVVCNGTEWQSGIEAEGLDFIDLPWLPPTDREDDFGWRMWGIPVRMAPLLADLLRPWRPDALVSDTLTTVGGFTAGLLGLPWATVIPHPLQDMSAYGPPPGCGLMPGVTPEEKRRDAYLRRKAGESLALSAQQRLDALAEVGLPADHYPTVRLVATLPALEIARPDWPSDTVVVGPLEWDPATVELALPRGEQPLVFLSASTMSDVGSGLLQVALEALDGLGVRLASTQFARYAGSLPSWASVGPGRQDPAIHAASLVLSGAGHGIIAKALTRGTPLVVVPGEGEQRDNAMRLQWLGVGEMVEAFELSPETVRAAVTKVLGEPSYTQRAVEAAAVRTCDGGEVRDPVEVLVTYLPQTTQPRGQG